MVLPEVVGFKLTGKMQQTVTVTDVVLTCVSMLRKLGVVGKFVEFFGDGCQYLTIADRATIANMAPEYGATMGFFPVDEQALIYLRQTGRSAEKVKMVETYSRQQGLFRDYCVGEDAAADPVFSSVLELDLGSVVPCVSGPKRPHDHVALKDMTDDFKICLTAPTGFKGFGLDNGAVDDCSEFVFKGETYHLSHGSVVLAAITSCTNTSNPGVMLGAGLLAHAARTLRSQEGGRGRPIRSRGY